jgi:hypothetical protein
MDPVSDYWFRRIDAHMDRANELFDRNERAFERFVAADDRNTEAFNRNTEAFNRNTEAFNRNTEAFEKWNARQDEFHEFVRELTLRVERTGREHSRAIRRMGDEIVTELRAQRGALLAILDRMQPGDSGSAA